MCHFAFFLRKKIFFRTFINVYYIWGHCVSLHLFYALYMHFIKTFSVLTSSFCLSALICKNQQISWNFQRNRCFNERQFFISKETLRYIISIWTIIQTVSRRNWPWFVKISSVLDIWNDFILINASNIAPICVKEHRRRHLSSVS